MVFVAPKIFGSHLQPSLVFTLTEAFYTSILA